MYTDKILDRSVLSSDNATLLSKGKTQLQADVYKVVLDDQFFVVKDYSRVGGKLSFVSKWCATQEVRALKQLDGLASVPRLVGQLDSTAFAMEFVDGKGSGGASVPFFSAVRKQIKLMHAYGVAHNDMHTRNIMDSHGKPIFIDFVTAIIKPKSYNPLYWPRHIIFALSAANDRMRGLRYQWKVGPDSLNTIEYILLVPMTVVRKAAAVIRYSMRGLKWCSQHLTH